MITGAVVPLYVHPLVDARSWQIAAGEGAAARCIVVNVADGPGLGAPDEEYVTWFSRLSHRGVRVAGYVDCDYGTRSSERVSADVERWRGVYDVRSFFLDRYPSAALSSTRRTVQWMRSTGAELIVANPGTEAPIAATADVNISVAFEGRWSDYRRAVRAGSVRSRGAGEIAHLVYAVPRHEHQRARALADELGALSYVTSGDGANPWGQLLETSPPAPPAPTRAGTGSGLRVRRPARPRTPADTSRS